MEPIERKNVTPRLVGSQMLTVRVVISLVALLVWSGGLDELGTRLLATENRRLQTSEEAGQDETTRRVDALVGKLMETNFGQYLAVANDDPDSYKKIQEDRATILAEFDELSTRAVP